MPALSLRAALAGLTVAVGAAALACEDTAAPAGASNAPAISADVAPPPAPDGAFTATLDHGIKIMTHPQHPLKVVSANVYIDGDGDGLVAGKAAKSFVDGHTHPGPTMVIVSGGTLTMHHADNCDHVESYRVWRSRQGRFALHTEASEQWVHTAGADGQVTGWRKHLVADQQWGQIPATATLEVFETLDEMEPRVPAELFAIVSANAELPEVEDLDI